MRKISEKLFSLLEAVAYGFLGSIFVLIILLIEESLTRISCPPNFSCNYAGRGIALGGVLLGATLSVIFWNLVFGKIIKSAFMRWFLILISSSITAISLQTAYLISISHMTIEQITSIYFSEGRVSELLGIELITKLLIILTPFTLLFASRHFLLAKLKNRNSLK